MRAYFRFWTATVAFCLATLVLAALVLPNCFAGTAISDVVQSILLFSGTMSLVPHVVRSRGRLRLFWTLILTGITFWFTYQLVWTYYEVWLRTDVPDLCAADMILFLHIVPLLAALALRPHAPQDEYAARLRRLDFALMMVWWGYLYLLIVIPWQYVVADVTAYNNNLNWLYLIEKLAFLSTLAIAWLRTKGGWRVVYGNLFGACFTYAAGSHLANWAINRHLYYSGSFYDIPLAISMAWITVVGLWTGQTEPQAGVRTTSTSHGVWLARLGMIAAGELLRLLTHSRESLANLKRLQTQITESEKLASIGQLVGGAAHELNNPITAMLGYSDLLLSTSLSPEQNQLAAKIGQHVRRTRSLVASLLSFAKQGPATMAPVDINTLLRTAVKLSQPQWQALQIEVRTEFGQDLLLVRGDSNQLLQVCVQIINDALHVVDQHGSRTLTISAERKECTAIINISHADEPGDFVEYDRDMLSAPQTLSGLGLSACQGILRQHRGKILWQQDLTGRTSIRVEIPASLPQRGKSSEAGVPVMWQPQPSA